MRGLDYSAGRIPGAALRAAGYGFVVRYVDDPARGLNSKHIRPEEFKDLVANGVTCWLVHEVGTTDWSGGFAAGADHARRARAGADWIGYPQGGVIFFCADMHLTAGQIPAALAYLDGAASVIGRGAVGCYGFFEFVDAAIAQGKAAYYWQCGIAPDATDPVHIWQRNDIKTTVGGVAVDINELLRPIGSAAPAPSAPGGIESMAFTDKFTDWAGNPQDVMSWMNHVDERLARLDDFMFTPGAWQSEIQGDENRTNGGDAIKDLIARVTIAKAEIEELFPKVDALSAEVAAVRAPSVASVDLDALAAKVAAQLGGALAKAAVDNDAIATRVADLIAQRMAR